MDCKLQLGNCAEECGFTRVLFDGVERIEDRGEEGVYCEFAAIGLGPGRGVVSPAEAVASATVKMQSQKVIRCVRRPCNF